MGDSLIILKDAKKKCQILYIIVSLFTTNIIINSCEKPERYVKIKTLEEAIEITYTSVTLKGEVLDLGSKTIDDHGILVSVSAIPRLENSIFQSLGPLTSKGPFEVTITGLTKNTLYYFRAFVTVDGTDIFSEQTYSFRTKDTETASVAAGALSDTTMISASLSGEVTADGGEAVSKRGLVWSLSSDPSLTSFLDTTINGSGTGTFISTMTGLTPGTQYHVRAYATNAKGTSYSPTDIIFTTHRLPVVTTATITNVTNTSAVSGGEVTDEGGVPVIARGIVWSTSSDPLISLPTKHENGKGAGSFTGTISGLTPGVTYFVRAYATSKYGTSYGNEVQVTSTKPSDATTLATTIIGNTVATLNGSVNANNFSATVSFEYGTTISYGTTVDASPKTVTGSSATSVSAYISGLAPGTEYHFRIRSVNAGGETLGGDMTFSTTDSPIPVTLSATSVANTSVTLNGSVNANNSATSVSFEYGLTTAYGSSATATPGIINGNTSTTISAELTGLTQGTVYHYRVRAISVGGTSYGEDMTFRTTQPPTAVTSDASSVSNSGAVLNGSVNANDLETAITFEYGTSTTYGSSVATSPGSLSGSTTTSLTATLSELTTGTQYHYRIKAVSTAGITYGSDHIFTTLQAPTAATSSATSVTNTSATLNGTVSANGSATTVNFEYGPTTSYGFTATASQGPVTGQAAPVSSVISGLTPGATYHYRVVASNTGGSSNGVDQTFTTTQPPVAATNAATAIGATTATLNGTVNAKGLSTIITFEYGTSTSYGQTATALQSPVTGSTNMSVSIPISSLFAATSYHCRVKAESVGGTAYGNDAMFTTSELSSTITDIDGNIYEIISIGSQNWLKQNLKATKFNNGDVISNYSDGYSWNMANYDYQSAYCWYNNDIFNKNPYGALYNWFAATDVRNVCPNGWHVPNNTEWYSLYYSSPDGGLGLIESGPSSDWTNPNPSASNFTGFTALPSGQRDYSGTFHGIGENFNGWTTTLLSSAATYFGLSADGGFGNSPISRTHGSSIRCIKGGMPLAETDIVTKLTSTSTVLNGKVNANGETTSIFFEYGTTSDFESAVSLDQGTINGSTPIQISVEITGLSSGTTYYYRIKAINSAGTVYGNNKNGLLMSFTTPPFAIDADGNTYNSVQIGSQIWLKENLKTTKLNDGTLIPYAPVDVDWRYLGTPAYCWPANNITNKAILGGIYNWHVVNTNKICPIGWHVPTSTEFNTLITSLGGSSVAGGKLKSLAGWNSPNIGATNDSNFEARSAGMRDRDGAFLLFGVAADFWCKDQFNTEQASIFQLSNNSAAANTSNYFFPAGMSIRCIKD